MVACKRAVAEDNCESVLPSPIKQNGHSILDISLGSQLHKMKVSYLLNHDAPPDHRPQVIIESTPVAKCRKLVHRSPNSGKPAGAPTVHLASTAVDLCSSGRSEEYLPSDAVHVFDWMEGKNGHRHRKYKRNTSNPLLHHAAPSNGPS
jgi:hypothetical protein